MLKLKVGNFCMQRTEPIKQKKRNRIKIRHQLKYTPAKYDAKN